MKRCLHLSLFVFLLAGMTACSVKPRDIPYDTPAGEVKLISFNIRQSGMAKKDGPDRWAKRRDAVLNMIERESPSVLGIQEGLIDQVRYIERGCPQFARIGVGRDDGAQAGEIMAIFYRSDYFELLDWGTFWLSETPSEVSRGWDAVCNRTVTWAQLREKATRKTFYYLNTHFDHQGAEARRESVRLIADFIRDRIPADATVVAGGDLNSTIDDEIFEPLKALLQVARDIAEPTDRGGTFNGFGSAPGNIVLDHLFCRNVADASLRTLRDDFGGTMISDHYPVEFIFRLPGNDRTTTAE